MSIQEWYAPENYEVRQYTAIAVTVFLTAAMIAFLDWLAK